MMDKGQNIKEILLPELGEGVKEGEFLKWHVGVGDLIKIDQGLCDVHTDKASLEVPSPCDGRVIELRARKGDTLHVGQVLLLVNLERQVDIIPKEEEKNPNTKQKKTNQDKTKQEDIPSIYPETNKPKVQTFFDPPSSVDESKNKNKEPEEGILTQPDKGVLALPYTRKLAKELGIDLKKIKGSGLFGRITKEDVLKQKEPYNMREDIEEEVKGLREWSFEKQNLRLGFRVPRLPLQDRVPLKGIRKVISERLTLSKKMIPHFSLMDSANVDKLVHIRSSLKERLKEENIKLS